MQPNQTTTAETTVGAITVDGRTVRIVSDHATWQAAKGAYTQRAASRCTLATTRPAQWVSEGSSAERVVD